MRKRKLRIIFCIALIVLVDLGVVGLLIYEILVQKKAEATSFARAGILLGASVLSIVKLFQRYEIRRSAKFYRETYTDLIGNAFWHDKKAEKEFCRALDAYNANNFHPALKRLEQLSQKITTNDDRFAITVFTALCYDDMKAYPQAIHTYEDALRYRENSTVFSNLGLCYQRIGDYKSAIVAYVEAIRVDPKNDYAYVNAAQLMIRAERYEDALAYAEQACAINQSLMSAHTVRAVCHAVLGNSEETEQAIRRSVRYGADRRRLEDAIRIHCPSYQSGGDKA